MKFLIDAQLPARLAVLLNERGFDAIHTTSLPDGNRMKDRDIAAAADSGERVVVSKDADFRNSHILQGMPRRLLVVATGNVSNNDLLALFDATLDAIVESFNSGSFVELDWTGIVVHPDAPR